MGDEDRDQRWQELMGLHHEFEGNGEPSAARARGGSRQRKPSRKAARFDEALSGFTTWSAPAETQRRRPAA